MSTRRDMRNVPARISRLKCNRMECGTDAISLSKTAVPLFPLPNVVLFPRAVLPLHIFEERYKAMTAHALAGDRLVAMALFRPGWQASYYARPAIEPIVCVGQIVSSERLDDGKYNFLLHGLTRAKILSEESSTPYRTARLEPFCESPVMEIDLTNERQRLMEILCREPLAALPQTDQLKRIVSSPLSTGQVADLIAFHVLTNIPFKQSILADADIPRRVSRVIDALDAAVPMLELAHHGHTSSGSFN
jgi:Lon protease-like protein